MKKEMTMPYIPNEEEQARADKFKTEREEKEMPMREAFTKLTPDQQHVLNHVYKILDNYAEELRDMEGDCYHSTFVSVTQLYYKLHVAFPNLRDD